MSEGPRYVGFDLGTTNSAAAVFDGERTEVVRNAQGGTLTPSVVRISAQGALTVGAKARRFLDRDADNTRTGFKRLMGTDTTLNFPAAGVDKTPVELSSAILRSLIADVKTQCGFIPEQAVVTVPALFELPQSRATTEAAQAAGLHRVELVQEPVASALAAGFAHDQAGHWMVFDLGGGTFDATLLASENGVLRVVGHDGDNFLGGRDFDNALVDWAAQRIFETHGIKPERNNPAHAVALRTLTAPCEEAKIELSRSERTELAPMDPLVVDGRELDVAIPIERTTLERLTEPLVERALEVCFRLLQQTDRHKSDIERVVLVGGPTAIPLIQREVATQLAPLAQAGHDPMTLVATGAALFAASSGLTAGPMSLRVIDRPANARAVLLQHPSMSMDLNPFVVGRVVDPTCVPHLKAVRTERLGPDGFSSAPAEVDADGAFAFPVELLPKKANRFALLGVGHDDSEIALDPPQFTIVHGLTLGDPPLSRSVGVALANDAMHTYFERGTPLPAKRTFVHYTVEATAPGAEDTLALRIPLVQGEFDRASLCRLVGAIEISAADLDQVLPSGTPIEVSLALDRGGHLSARAHVPRLKKTFDNVAQLLVPQCTPEVLEAEIGRLNERLEGLRADAFRMRMPELIAETEKIGTHLADAENGLEAAKGGDEETAQRARRNLLDVDAAVAELELRRDWPEIESDAIDSIAWAASWVSNLGTETEQVLLQEAIAQVAQAREAMDAQKLTRRMRRVKQLGEAAYYRHPESWIHMFEHAASRADESADGKKAAELVAQGRAAIERGDDRQLRNITEQLWGVLPIDAKKRQRAHFSGVR